MPEGCRPLPHSTSLTEAARSSRSWRARALTCRRDRYPSLTTRSTRAHRGPTACHPLSDTLAHKPWIHFPALFLLKKDVYPCSAFTAASAAWNPILLWVPSQNGLFVEAPQRQRENAGLPVKS